MINIKKNKFGLSVNIKKKSDDINSYLKKIYYDLGLNYPKFFKMDNFCKLGVLGTELLYRQDKEFFHQRERIGIILQNSIGSLDTDIKHQYGIEKNTVSPSVFVYTLPNIVIAEISIKFKWNSEGVFFIDQEIDPILLAQYSNMMLKENRTDINILGWIEVLESDLELRLLALDSKITYKELSSIICYSN